MQMDLPKCPILPVNAGVSPIHLENPFSSPDGIRFNIFDFAANKSGKSNNNVVLLGIQLRTLFEV